MKTQPNAIREALRECLYIKKTNRKEGKLLIKKTLDIIRKKNIYLQLKKELEYHSNLNKEYKKWLEIIKERKVQTHKNKNEVEAMCRDLKATYKEFAVIVDKYDDKVTICNQEKERIIKTNEDIIDIKNNEKAKLKGNLKQMEEKNEIQRKKIEALEAKLKKLKKQKDKENEEYLKKDKADRLKYEKLRRNFENLKYNLKHYTEENKKYEIFNIDLLTNATVSNQIVYQEDKEIELNEKKMQNQLLQEQIKSISFKITRLSSTDFVTTNYKSTVSSPKRKY